jgi:gamma-glutamylputrescine oxidase
MFSYWEQQSFLHYDNIVIGSGIVGLSTAIELKERFPDERTLVLERSLFPYGASTRNAGFACMGSFTELLDDLKTNSEAEMVSLFIQRKKGLNILRERLTDGAIDYRERGSYELIAEHELPLLERLGYINELIAAQTGNVPFVLANEKIAASGFAADKVNAMIENTGEGELHSGKMMRALTDFAIQKGVEIKTGAAVSSFHEEGKIITVQVNDAIRNDMVPLQCNRLFICTNAFTKRLLPDEDITPGRGQVLITEPIPDLPFKGIYHFDEGYYYFREIDGRILFGGGRNLDFTGETSTEIVLNERIQKDLEDKLHNLILPGRNITIAQRWAGIMAFGDTKRPLIKRFGQNVYGAFRMGGMGVALGSATAREIVLLIEK